MNTAEGLRRIAQAIRVMFGWLAIAGAALGILNGLGMIGASRVDLTVVTSSIVAALVFYAVGAGIAWIIDGFAKPQE